MFFNMYSHLTVIGLTTFLNFPCFGITFLRALPACPCTFHRTVKMNKRRYICALTCLALIRVIKKKEEMCVDICSTFLQLREWYQGKQTPSKVFKPILRWDPVWLNGAGQVSLLSAREPASRFEYIASLGWMDGSLLLYITYSIGQTMEQPVNRSKDSSRYCLHVSDDL